MKRAYLLALLLFIIPIAYADNYTANFVLDKNGVQLGDEFTLSGEIYKNSNLLDEQVNALIYFISKEEIKEVYVSILDGKFSTKNRFINTLPGTYEIDIILKDLDGNVLQEFNNAASISIEDKLEIRTTLKNDKISPGEILKIEGTIGRVQDSKPVQKAKVEIQIDDLILTTDAANGEFLYSFSTSPTIKSNYHDIKIIARDEFGNKGEDNEKIFIKPVPTELKTELNKNVFLPSETVRITPILLDQANDQISSNVEIRIYDSKNKRISKEIIETSKVFNLELGKYPIPGQWKIKLKASRVESESSFLVETVEQLNIVLEKGNILKVENVGNIKYEKILEISLIENGKQEVIRKRTNIKPGDSFNIDLNKELNKGSHELKIPNTNQTIQTTIDEGRSFGQRITDTLSSITGQVVQKPGTGPSNTPTYSFIGFLVIMIILIIYRVKASRKPGASYKIKRRKSFGLFGLFKTRAIKNQKKEEINELKEKILGNANQSQNISKKPSIEQPPKEQKPLRVNFDEPFKFK